MTSTDRRHSVWVREPLLPAIDDAASEPPGGRHRRRAKRSRRARRPRWLAVGFVPGLLVLYVIWSIAGAAATPGNQGFEAKWADWLRHHHAAFAITDAERFYYSLKAPAKGGRPKGLNALPAPSRSPGPTVGGEDPTGRPTGPGATEPDPTGGTPTGAATPTRGPAHLRSHAGAAGPSRRHRAPAPPAHLPAPPPVPLVVRPALPKEGAWQPVGPRIDGIPGMYEAQFRADTVYTGEITSAVWIDPKLLRVALVPGQTDPGGRWSIPPYITEAERAKVEAAFNGGFLFSDANGGFYLDGRTAVPLVRGAASLVLYRNGALNVGSWGTEVHMTPQVMAVLQNLVPMVDHGRVSPSATYQDFRVWGATLGAAPVVARSGLGVTRDGALVYVAGPALTARTLAESLQRAGAVRAMTLDMNPEWVTFNFFSHPDPARPTALAPSKLYPQMQRPATRYLGPTSEARDFFTVSLPPGRRP